MSEFLPIAAVVLAAGKGTRIGQKLPKVLYPIAGKPMIHYTLNLLDELHIEDKIVVVGFRADEVKAAIGRRCAFAFQDMQLGSAHALLCGLNCVHPDIEDVLVINGDDSAFYEPETIFRFIASHRANHAVMSFISVMKKNPTDLGRVIRGFQKNAIEIREEKEATNAEKRLKEVNCGCYLFNYPWLKSNSEKIEKSQAGEYYITDYIKLAARQHKKINAFLIHDNNQWFGVNSLPELEKANQLMIQRNIQRNKPTVFFMGLDYVLLDSDRLKHYITDKILRLTTMFNQGLDAAEKLEKTGEIFWDIYESIRARKGFVDMPEIIHDFVQKIGIPDAEYSFKSAVLSTPFVEFMYPDAQALLKNLQRFGEIVIIDEGDLVYQPIKIRGMQLESYINDYYIFEDIKSAIPHVVAMYDGWRHIVIEDQVSVIGEFRKIDKNAVGIWVRQGKYKDNVQKQAELKPHYEVSSLDKVMPIIPTV